MPDHSAEIAYLEGLINSAEKSSTNDGSTVVNDLDFAKKRLAELKRTDTAAGAQHMVKPLTASIRIRGL